MLLRDFNALIGSQERCGNFPLIFPVGNFVNSLMGVGGGGSVELSTAGTFYTWNNGRRGNDRVESRIDRALDSTKFFSFWDKSVCLVLPTCRSNHHPILVSYSRGEVRFSWFRFQSMWLDHPNLLQVILTYWNWNFPNPSFPITSTEA